MSRAFYAWGVAREITQRELRNESGETMRARGRGETFVVTRRRRRGQDAAAELRERLVINEAPPTAEATER